MATPNAEELAEIERLLKGICDRRPQNEDAWRAAEIGLTLVTEIKGMQERFLHVLALARTQELHNCIAIAEKYSEQLYQAEKEGESVVSPGGACNNLAAEFKTLLPLEPPQE